MQPFTFFISYRRKDTAPIALLLKYEIEKRLQFVRVFVDVENLREGGNFPDGIKQMIGKAHATIAMVDEIRAARSIPQVPMERIFEMVTTRAASILRLPAASSEIQEHGPADLVAVADHGQSPADALNNLIPDLIMIGGRIRLLSRRLSMMRDLQRHIAGMQRISVQPS